MGIFSIGLATFALVPTLEAIKWIQIAIKGIDYALAKPAREALFTVVSRTEKYQSKSLIDAGLYRAFDAMDSSVVTALRDAHVAAPAMAWIAAPVAALGLPLAWLLSRMQRHRQVVRRPPLRSRRSTRSRRRDLLPGSGVSRLKTRSRRDRH